MTLIQALLLKFKPANMDVLPLYIVLLLRVSADPVAAVAPPDPGARRPRSLLYALTWHFGWNLPAYPSGTWFFNPFAWQLLFVFGAWCALGGAERLPTVLQSRVTLALAIAYLVFAFVDRDDLVFPAACANTCRTGCRTGCIRSTRSTWTSCGLRISWRWRW